MDEDKMTYRVGKGCACLMAAPEECRYPPEVELQLLEEGYVIRLHGKRVTKKEVLLRTR